MIPNNKQWKNWSMPSKHGFASLLVGVAGLLFSLLVYLAPLIKEPLKASEPFIAKKIFVVNARYGFNEMRDHTKWFVNRCNSVSGNCYFAMMPDRELGDHEHFVEKELSVTYLCGNENQNRVYRLEPATRLINLGCS